MDGIILIIEIRWDCHLSLQEWNSIDTEYVIACNKIILQIGPFRKILSILSIQLVDLSFFFFHENLVSSHRTNEIFL